MQKIDKESGFRNTVRVGLTMLARMYQKAETYHTDKTKEGTIICNISEVASVVADSSCFSKLTNEDLEVSIKGEGIQIACKDKRLDTSDMNYFHNINNIPGNDFLIIAM